MARAAIRGYELPAGRFGIRKLSEEQRRDIANSQETTRALAARYGINISHVNRIRRGDTSGYQRRDAAQERDK